MLPFVAFATITHYVLSIENTRNVSKDFSYRGDGQLTSQDFTSRPSVSKKFNVTAGLRLLRVKARVKVSELG